MRLVGWYHSHPYFRNQPSLVDVENQSRYQKMFGETGQQARKQRCQSTACHSSAASSPRTARESSSHCPPASNGHIHTLTLTSKHHGRTSTTVTPRCLSPGVSHADRFLLHCLSRCPLLCCTGFTTASGVVALAAGEMPDEPMEMWTDIAEQLDHSGGDDKEQKQAAAEVEGFEDLLDRLRALCEEYGSVHGRVDFFERWQVGEENSGRRPTSSGDSADGLSSSQLSPSEVRRTASLANAADVRNKLDQFRQSVTAHLALLNRWKEANKRRLVDELITAVCEWKGSGGQRTKQRRQEADEQKDGDETDTEGDEDDNDKEEEKKEMEEDEEDEEEEEEMKQRNQPGESSDEMVADSQQLDST